MGRDRCRGRGEVQKGDREREEILEAKGADKMRNKYISLNSPYSIEYHIEYILEYLLYIFFRISYRIPYRMPYKSLKEFLIEYLIGYLIDQ